MTNEEVINVLNTIYENPTASEQIKEACIVAMEAVDIKNSVERITTGLQISSAESEAKGTMTNAEAIKTIKSIVETLDDYAFYTEEDKVAFDFAIKALEEEDIRQTRQSDIKNNITTKEAIGILNKHARNVSLETIDDWDYQEALFRGANALEREEGCRNKYGIMAGFHCSGCGNSWEENAHDFNYCPNCGRRIEK